MQSIAQPLADENRYATTGVPGLDDVLNGGLSRGHVFLLEGSPGTGKTTIALNFLIEGARIDEKGLYITLSESEKELRAGGASHGWTIGEKITIFEVVPSENLLDERLHQSLLYSSDLELGETTKLIFEVIEKLQPKRIVIDSLSEVRLLAQSSLRYRRQILTMKHYFARHGSTVLLLDDLTSEAADKTVHSVVHGVVKLEELSPAYGAERRRMRILKYRGQSYRGGYHDFIIREGGVQVFPRLVAGEHRRLFTRTPMSSGNRELDSLLGGGIEQGSSALIIGPAGTGKSIFSFQFVCSAIHRGEKAAVFVFDEELGLLFERMRAIGMDLEALRKSGALLIEQLDAAELSPGEFADRVRKYVAASNVKYVAIDSLNGYQAAMPEENSLILHIHELLQYLNRQGATTLLTVAQHGLLGEMRSPIDLTYLADSVILLRYFESDASVRRAVSVVKKRTGRHEKTIREYSIGQQGICLGPPLIEFRGILHGVPQLIRQAEPANPGDQPAKLRE